MPRSLNRDLMHMAQPLDVARSSMAVIDRIQDYRPEVQVLAAAAVFLTLANHWGVPAQDAFTAVTNVMNERDGKRRVEFEAVDAYVENEL